jgi:hypothetical protein
VGRVGFATALAQLELVGEETPEALRRNLRQIERRPTVEDPFRDRLAERGRHAETADAAAAHDPRAGDARERADEIAVVHGERRQPTAVLGHADHRVLEDRELLAHAPGQPPQHLDVERQIRHVERRRQRGRLELERMGLVSAQHQAAAIVPHVDVGIDDAGDRELGPDSGDRLGDQELMAGRHDR